jgi:hypothetical protein
MGLITDANGGHGMQIGFHKQHGHKKVRYMLDKPEMAYVLLDHWAGNRNNHDMERVTRFQRDVETCGLTLAEFLTKKWAG